MSDDSAPGDDLIGLRVEWQGQSWFVADARFDEDETGGDGHWHLTLTSPDLSRVRTPVRPRRERQTTGSNIEWKNPEDVPGAVLSAQAQHDLDKKLRAIDEAQARARVSGASYVIYR